MHRTCIAVVDATRARILAYERSAEPDGLHEHFSELGELVDPERQIPPHELFTDSSRRTYYVGHENFAFDDHRTAHVDGMDADFARVVIAEIDRVVHSITCHRLVLCAGPRMLGTLRRFSGVLRHNSLPIAELPYDLIKLSTKQLHQQLASRGVLPPHPPAFRR